MSAQLTSRRVFGVDLGKRLTPTTIIGVEQQFGEKIWDPFHLCWRSASNVKILVRWIESVALGTTYEGVAHRLWWLAQRTGTSEIWMDGTGVGVAVEEIVRKSKPAALRCVLRPVTIGGGHQAQLLSVSRKELLTRLAIEWEQQQIRVVPGLSRWPELRKELLALDPLGRKLTTQDDLALALALAVWGLKGAKAPNGERNHGRLV